MGIFLAAMLISSHCCSAVPALSHTPPATVDTSGPIPIEAFVQPNGTVVQAVYVHYRPAGETIFIPQVMSDAGSGTWKGQIPQQAVPGNVSYYFEITYAENGADSYSMQYPNDGSAYAIDVKQGLPLATIGVSILIALLLMGGALFIFMYPSRRRREREDRELKDDEKGEFRPPQPP
ncbi:MAG: hypothetical protein HZB92_09110 [Euryarchaeota archaeon]|nr:hypothetical protein [Euryarchaeota archaeon]